MGTDRKKEITYYESQHIGEGLPFVIVGNKKLLSNNDLFVPSLRDFHVVFWFKKGRGKYYIDFKEYEMKANTIALISKDHLHYFLPFEESCELQSIVFKPDFLYRKDTDLKHLFHFNAGSHLEGIQLLELDESDVNFLEATSAQMKSVYQNWEEKNKSEAFYHLLCLFLIKCEQVQQRKGVSLREVKEEDVLVAKFNDLLERNFRKEAKVEFYTEQLGLTGKSLGKLLKDQYKISAKAVIDERRMLEIKRLLKGTTKAVKEIAYDLGFDEPTNMVKYFKKHTGLTPNAFRETGI